MVACTQISSYVYWTVVVPSGKSNITNELNRAAADKFWTKLCNVTHFFNKNRLAKKNGENARAVLAVVLLIKYSIWWIFLAHRFNSIAPKGSPVD